ncbi:MAG: hypothetical protein RL367_2862 [Pseudomonadota bacterium]|jgi:hypothetical protein
MTRKFFQLFVAGFASGAVMVAAFAGAGAAEQTHPVISQPR